MKLTTQKKYAKAFKKLPQRQQEASKEAILRFVANPFDDKLHNHALTGAFRGLRSIDVAFDLRIIFRELSEGKYELVSLERIGTHSQLYK